MSAARNAMPRERRVESSRALDAEGELMVEGRRRTVKVGWEAGEAVEERRAREWRIGRPSSPAPTTSMEEGMMEW